METKNRRNIWLTAGGIGVVFVLFVLFVDVEAVVQQVAQADWRFLSLAALVLLAGLVAYALRWRVLLGDGPGRDTTFHAANVGHMFNLLIPLRAGEPARVFTLARNSDIALTHAASSIVVEKLFEQVLRLVALSGAIIFGVGLKVSPVTGLGGVLFVFGSFGLMLWAVANRVRLLRHWPSRLARLPRVTEEGARRALTAWLENLAAVATPGRLARTLLWSLVTWAIFWGFHMLVLRALPISLSGGDLLALSLGSLALVTPSAPTQPGLYHASLVAPLLLVGYDETLLTAYAVLLHITQMVLMIGLGLWGLSASQASFGDLLSARRRVEAAAD